MESRTGGPIRVVIIDDEPLFREGVRIAAMATTDVAIVGEAPDGETGLAVIAAARPDVDVAVVDLALAGMDGVAIARALREREPGVRVLMMTVHDRVRDVFDALAAGALGYALKTEPPERFVEAVRTVARGERYIAATIDRHVIDARERRGDGTDVLAVLSARERDVFHLIVRGATNNEIAAQLGVSPKTIDTHRARINEKLSCRSTADLVRFAVANELVRAGAGVTS